MVWTSLKLINLLGQNLRSLQMFFQQPVALWRCWWRTLQSAQRFFYAASSSASLFGNPIYSILPPSPHFGSQKTFWMETIAGCAFILHFLKMAVWLWTGERVCGSVWALSFCGNITCAAEGWELLSVKTVCSKTSILKLFQYPVWILKRAFE